MHDQGILFGIESCDLELCEHYIISKHKRVYIITTYSKSYDILQLIHCDFQYTGITFETVWLSWDYTKFNSFPIFIAWHIWKGETKKNMGL